MRIISDFRDYYDTVQQQDQDRTLRYHRRERKEVLPELPFPALGRCDWGPLGPKGLVVGFCGKLYPLIRLPCYGMDESSMYCYTAAAVARWITTYLDRKQQQEYVAPLHKKRRWVRDMAANTRIAIETFFTKVNAEHDKYRDLFAQFDAPVFIADHVESRFIPSRHGHLFVINPCLRDIEFFKVMDTYTAFQELSMYLGAQARPELPIPPIDDVTMAEAKGFNKYSFRKDPGQKKRKRRKT